MTVIEPPEREPLNDLRWIRWHRGSLVAIQGAEVGKLRLVRLRLDDTGRRVRSVDVLDAGVALAGPTSATLSGNTVFYLGSNARRRARGEEADAQVAALVLPALAQVCKIVICLHLCKRSMLVVSLAVFEMHRSSWKCALVMAHVCGTTYA